MVGCSQVHLLVDSIQVIGSRMKMNLSSFSGDEESLEGSRGVLG